MNASGPLKLPSLTPIDLPAPPTRPVAPPVVVPPLPVRVIRTTEQGLLDEDIVCRACGYNLRGLPTDGQCPECRMSVANSIRGDYLQFSVPTWVARLARGVRWILIGIFSNMAASVLNVGIVAFLGVGITGAPGSSIAMALIMGVHFLVAAVMVTGFWLLTSPDPASVDSEPVLCVRNVARWALLLTTLQEPLQALVQPAMSSFRATQVGPSGAGSFSTTIMLGAVVYIAMAAITLIGYAAIFIHARRLVTRIPRPVLAKQTGIVMGGYLTAKCAGLALIGTLVIIGPAGMGSISFMLVIWGLLSMITGVLSLVFGIWAIVMLFIVHSAFKSAAAHAQVAWANVSDPSRGAETGRSGYLSQPADA